MNKKTYKTPKICVEEIQTTHMLCGSNDDMKAYNAEVNKEEDTNNYSSRTSWGSIW